MADHYVDSAASAGGDGSYETPWDTLADVNGHTFTSDDFIYIKRDSLFREQLTVGQSGTDGHPITYTAYGSGDLPKIYGSTAITGWTVYSGNIWQATTVVNPTWIFFVNTDGSIKWGTKQANADACDAEYEFFSNGTTMYCYALTDPDSRYTSVEAPTRNRCILLSQSYVTADALDLRYPIQYGVGIDASSEGKTGDIVQNCYIAYGGVSAGGAGDGVNVRGTNHQILNNVIHDFLIHGIYMVSTSSGEITTGCVGRGNTVYDCYHTLLDMTNFGISGGTCSGNTYTRNFLYTTPDYAFPSSACNGIYFDGSGTGKEMDNIEVSCNIIFNILDVAIEVGAYCTDINLFNNTCYGTNSLNTTRLAVGIFISTTGVSGVVIKNNIVQDFYSGAGGGDCCLLVQAPAKVSTCDYNCWYQSTGGRVFVNLDWGNDLYHSDDFAQLKIDYSGWETNGFWEDPKFVNAGGDTAEDYKLASDSPLINKGFDVGLTEDYWGTPVPALGAPDIGAHEYDCMRLTWTK